MKFLFKRHKQIIASLLLATSCTVHALDFSIFGDITFSDSDAKNEPGAFALGALDLYATQRINDKTTGFVELVFEHNGEGFVSDLERLWVRHDFSDALQVAGGRFHSPLGYWNRTFHHGTYLQDSVGRPFFMDFEDGSGGILPVHLIGLMATGDVGSFNYQVGISNGAGLDTSTCSGATISCTTRPELNANNTSDQNTNKAVIARGTYAPEDVGFQVSLFTMIQSIAESATSTLGSSVGSSLFEQTIIGFDAHYETEMFDFTAEYFNITNDSNIGDKQSHSADAYYLQFGYRVYEAGKGYYRYASLDFDDADSYFQILATENKQVHHVIGFRHDVDEVNSVKIEFDRFDRGVAGLKSSNSIKLQWSFLIP